MEINNTNIDCSCSYMETAYIENKIYILMAGCDSKSHYYAQCYDKDKNEIHHYINNNDKSSNQIKCLNLFNKGNKIEDIDLIVCKNDKIEVFNFESKNLIREILINDVKNICIINQKYMIISEFESSKIKIIDKEYSFLNEGYPTFSSELQGVKKIKIPEIGECIVTISAYLIKIWKI